MMSQVVLKSITETVVRFSEVDSMAVVWHGNYIKFLEDGREDFGKKFGIGYLDVYHNELMTPIVKISMEYKKPLFYGDTALIETTYIDTDSAKIQFEYKIFRKSDNELIATGESTQVFLNLNRELELTTPPFMEEWKRKMGLLKD